MTGATTKLSVGTKPKGHPKGLYLLFTAEMWERMSYYGMRALLVLYMTEKLTKGGFGWTKAEALSIYGWYTGLVYVTPLIGGALADKVLGQRKAVLIGGLLMMLGHFLMAAPGKTAFFAALVLLVIGNGFFKPNISTMVGGLYEQGDSRRDGAFTIFYMGINLGALIAPLICGTLGEKFGFHWGFGAAGVGMLLGLVVYVALAERLLGDVGKLSKDTTAKADEKEKVEAKPLTKVEKDRLLVICILAVFTVMFWGAFEQAGGLMTLYTKEKVNRNIGSSVLPISWFQSLNPLFILIFAPMFSKLWSYLGSKGKDPSTPFKMGAGLVLLGIGFVFMTLAAKISDGGSRPLWTWLVAAYFFHTIGELCLSPIGLSMVTKMAPKHLASLMMGVWFFATAIANKGAATLGAYSEKLGELTLFGGIAGVTIGSGLLLFVIGKPIEKLMHEGENTEGAEKEF